MNALADKLGIMITTSYILIALLIIVFLLQYYLFIHLDFKLKKFNIAVGVLLAVAIIFTIKESRGVENTKTLESLKLLDYTLVSSFLVSAFMAILREVVFSIRAFRFNYLIKKCHANANAKKLKNLSKVIPLHFRRNQVEKNEIEQLKSIYKSIKNDGDILLQTRIDYCKSIISIGVSNITIPRNYEINTSTLSNKSELLNVANGALNEAKLIVDIAPNACVFSCRKYAENLAKYLIKYYNISGSEEDNLDNFSTVLYLLNNSNVLDNSSIKQSFYQIKEIGNDAAHGQLCDKKTAKDVFEYALNIDEWFRISYKEIA